LDWHLSQGVLELACPEKLWRLWAPTWKAAVACHGALSRQISIAVNEGSQQAVEEEEGGGGMPQWDRDALGESDENCMSVVCRSR
jgi:hypothetical protein